MNAIITVKHDAGLLSQIDEVARECSISTIENAGGLAAAFKMASGMRKLRELITPEMMRDIMSLAGTRLGFKTDRDKPGKKPPYTAEEIKDAIIEGLLRGVRVVGNEINVISEQCYLTREFFTRALREYPGLTDLAIVYGSPIKDTAKGRFIVSARATWKLNGVPQSLEKEAFPIPGSDKMQDERYYIKYDDFTSDDAVLGKVDRKFKCAIYSRLTGSTFTEGSADESPDRSQPAATSLTTLTEQLKGKGETPTLAAPDKSSTANNPETPEGSKSKRSKAPTAPKYFTSPKLDKLALDLTGTTSVLEVNALRSKFAAEEPDEDAEKNRLCDERIAYLEEAAGSK